MAVYYIDPVRGCETADGLSPQSPKSDWCALPLGPGDTVLFRRGSRLFGSIHSPAGLPGQPVTWGAYGEGEPPVFTTCLSLDDPAGWQETAPHIWQWVRPLSSEPGNLIFDRGASCGTLRWELDHLMAQGDWFDTGFGKTEQQHTPRDPADRLYLYSIGNPAKIYGSIECAVYADRVLAKATSCAVFRDLAFYGSGVHGFAATDAEDIRIENCSFSFIGGMGWNKDLRIRFGNGVEFWNGGRHIHIEGCAFKEIYDSCFTHQGFLPYPTPMDITFCHCTCENYGMAAYEIRDIVPLSTVFAGNRCHGAGQGFAMQGETLPRRSEIWPQPMGHHLFIWRIANATPDGSILICDNQFGAAPHGSAVYSIVSKEAEAQMCFSRNHYTDVNEQTIHWNGGYMPLSAFEAGTQTSQCLEN